jgi:hypothetical protein
MSLDKKKTPAYPDAVWINRSRSYRKYDAMPDAQAIQ